MECEDTRLQAVWDCFYHLRVVKNIHTTALMIKHKTLQTVQRLVVAFHRVQCSDPSRSLFTCFLLGNLFERHDRNGRFYDTQLEERLQRLADLWFLPLGFRQNWSRCSLRQVSAFFHFFRPWNFVSVWISGRRYAGGGQHRWFNRPAQWRGTGQEATGESTWGGPTGAPDVLNIGKWETSRVKLTSCHLLF